MKSGTSLKYLYKKVLKDCQGLLETNIDKSNDESKNKESKAFEDEFTTCEILISFMEKYKNPKIKSQFIQNSISKYFTEIKNYIFCQNSFGDSFEECSEYDIYNAYGLLWSLRYVLNKAKIEEISKFNFKDYTNFAEFLNVYGNSKKLSKNYHKNFVEALGQLKLNENFVYSWIKKLKEKKLSSFKANSNIKQNEIKVKDNNVTPNFNDKSSLSRNEIKNEQICSNNSQTKKNSSKDNKTVLIPENISQNNNNVIPLKDRKIVIESGFIKNQIPLQDNHNQNNNIGDNFINNGLTFQKTPKDYSQPSTSIINVELNKNTHVDNDKIASDNENLSSNVFSNSQAKTENISSETTNFYNTDETTNEPLERKIITKMTDEKNTKNNFKKEDAQLKNNVNGENPKKNSEGQTKSEEINIENILKEIKRYSENDLEKNSNTDFPKEQLIKLVLFLHDRHQKMESEFNLELEKANDRYQKMESLFNLELEKANKRFLKLEENQFLMYHQLGLYENSRDIGKNICYFFFEYLDPKRLSANKFTKLKTIIDCLEGTYTNVKLEGLNQEMKTNLLKFFKFHFFINKVLNKILHRNISELSESLLKHQKESDILSLFPAFNFSQCFESLGYFVDKSWDNPEIQAIMKYVYDNMYKNDTGLENIFDKDKLVIIPQDNKIKFSLNKADIENVKNYFQNLKLDRYSESFDELCNKKKWDEEEKSN